MKILSSNNIFKSDQIRSVFHLWSYYEVDIGDCKIDYDEIFVKMKMLHLPKFYLAFYLVFMSHNMPQIEKGNAM